MCERIGRGSFGKVFRGELRDPASGVDPCAVKVCDIESDHDHQVVLREVALLRRASVHPNVVRFFGVLGLASSVHVYLELCLCSLADLVRERQAPLSEITIASAVYSVAQALRFLHDEMNTVHRDIKGANILLSTTGVVKLTDFNVSATLSTNRPACASATGTPQWMAPEVIMGEAYGKAADLWSLGVTVLELDGTVPHYSLDPMAAMFRIVTLPPPSLRAPDQHSLMFDALVRTLLVKNAHGRPTAAQLLEHECLLATGTQSERALVLCQLAFEYRQHQAFMEAATCVRRVPLPTQVVDAKRIGELLARDVALDAERKRLRAPDGRPIRLSDCPNEQQPQLRLTFPGALRGDCRPTAAEIELLDGLNPAGLCLSTPPTLVDTTGSSWDSRHDSQAERARPLRAAIDEFTTMDPGTTPPPTRLAAGTARTFEPTTLEPPAEVEDGAMMRADYVDEAGDAFVVMPPPPGGEEHRAAWGHHPSHMSTLCSTTVVLVEDYM